MARTAFSADLSAKRSKFKKSSLVKKVRCGRIFNQSDVHQLINMFWPFSRHIQSAFGNKMIHLLSFDSGTTFIDAFMGRLSFCSLDQPPANRALGWKMENFFPAGTQFGENFF